MGRSYGGAAVVAIFLRGRDKSRLLRKIGVTPVLVVGPGYARPPPSGLGRGPTQIGVVVDYGHDRSMTPSTTKASSISIWLKSSETVANDV